MAADGDPFRRSALMQPALRRVGLAAAAIALLWLCILWSLALA